MDYADLATLYVSEYSRFIDNIWKMPQNIPGQATKYGTIDWNVELPDGSLLTDKENAFLLIQFKVLVWSLFHAPREANAAAAGSMTAIAQGVTSVAAWMVSEGMTHFDEIDSTASWDFVRFFVESHEEMKSKSQTRPRVVSNATASARLALLSYMYRQRRSLRELGVEPPPEPPYDGRSIDDVVQNELDLHRRGKLDPIPDDVAIPLLSSAIRLIGQPAEDVLALQELCMHAFEHAPGTMEGKWCRLEKYHAVLAELDSFEFAHVEGETKAWHGPIRPTERRLRDGRVGTLRGTQLLRRLVITIQSAAIVCIQACTGMRAHEICGLDAGSSTASDLPACITPEVSSDGLMEIFYCHSVEAKQSKIRTRWVIGARSVGSNYLPPSVRAFKVLWLLYGRWRKLGCTSKLLITFSAAKGLPRKARSIGRMTVVALTNLQKDFLREHCDLSSASEASRAEFLERHRLRGHRWRTTFALFLFRIDSGLLPAISRHFHHLSTAMTERGYIGNDVSLIETLDSVRTMETARFLLEAIEGYRPTVGSVAKLIAQFRAKLQEDLQEPTLTAAVAFIVENDLRIFFLPYGHCFLPLQPEASRCHELGDTTHWSQRGPNVGFRSPSVCVGCPLFVADGGHLAFWEQRAASHAAALVDRSKRDPALRVVQARLNQAKAMVGVLSAKIRKTEAAPCPESRA
ncbi:hypothetical protein ASG75_10995 [Rhodanobacter sp. Soil772]|nr:hypothetical protein ASG75_10995 [Rhodanobacter sp. Soil772]